MKRMNKIIVVSSDQRSVRNIMFHPSHLVIIATFLLSLIAVGSYYLSKQITIESKENEIAKLTK